MRRRLWREWSAAASRTLAGCGLGLAMLSAAIAAETIAVKGGGLFPAPVATAKSDRLDGAPGGASVRGGARAGERGDRPHGDVASAGETPKPASGGRPVAERADGMVVETVHGVVLSSAAREASAVRPVHRPADVTGALPGGEPHMIRVSAEADRSGIGGLAKGTAPAAGSPVARAEPQAAPPSGARARSSRLMAGRVGSVRTRAAMVAVPAAAAARGEPGESLWSSKSAATSVPAGAGASTSPSGASDDPARAAALGQSLHAGRAGASAVAASADGEPGEILWSNKTVALPAQASDAAPPLHTGSASQPMDLAVPLRDGSFYLGDVEMRVATAGDVAVARARFLQVTAPLLRAEFHDRLKGLPADDGFLAVAALRQAGLDATFDSGKVEMRIDPTIEQRATGRLSASARREPQRSENLSAPAILAGYVNVRAGVSHASEPFLGGWSETSGRLAFDGALRWSDIVFESTSSVSEDGSFARGSSRLVYDMPEQALRFAAGDVAPLTTGVQGGGDLLGLSVEKSYRKLQPGRNIRATAGRSFRIERPSRVDVQVNGHTVQRLNLRPGDYDLADLPLVTGANDIALVIEDDVGNKRSLDFTLFSDRSLLAPGISEWALSAGVASRFGGIGRPDAASFYGTQAYDFATPVVTGFHERGLSPDLTGGVHLQAAPDAAMGGAGAALQTGIGFWTLDIAGSQSVDWGPGLALGLGYELANITGEDGARRSFRLAVDYTSAHFAPLETAPGDGNETMLELSAAYSQDLPWDMAGSLSGTYAVGRGHHADRYGIDVSLSRPIGPSAYAGVTAGYEVGGDGPYADDGGFVASLRLGYRIDERSSIDGGHDFGDGRSRLGYRYNQGSGVGSWNASADIERTAASTPGGAGDASIGGSLGYVGNRAELAVSQHAGLARLDTERIEQRTSVTVGTALAFADGRMAIGRPVTDGFAIIAPHDSLAGSAVQVGGEADLRGASGLLGPALVSAMPAYSAASVSYEVSELPVGYDLGAGAFDLAPAYKSGYRLTVGSDYTITAYGTLLDAAGEPVALLTGAAREDGGKPGPEVTVFTNRAGRFGAQGLRPGRWVLEMATEPPTRYVIDVPKDAVGLVKLDSLRPEAAR